jgi:hypothetical protein
MKLRTYCEYAKVVRRLETTRKAVWRVSRAEDVEQMLNMEEMRNKNWAMSKRAPATELLL